MTAAKDIVKVSITDESQIITQEGFGILNIVGKNLNSPNRLEYFSTSSSSAIAAMLAGGVLAPEYIAALAALSSNPKPSQIAISQIVATKILTFSSGTYTAGSITPTVNGVALSPVAYSSNKDGTLTALASAIQGASQVQTATFNSGAGTITITAASGFVNSISLDVSGITGTMTYALSTGANSEEYDTGLDAISLYDNGFYGVAIISRTAADVQKVMAWAEANRKQFATSSSDANIKNTSAASDTTSLAAINKAAGYERSYVLYDENASTKYGEVGWLANLLARTPGSYTGMFKKAAGTLTNKLTPTQHNNVLDKNANTYELINGVSMVMKSKNGAGKFFDVIHFRDWLESRLAENVFGYLAKVAKSPYTPEGMEGVRTAMVQILELGITNKGISEFNYDDDNVQIGGYYIIMPNFASITANTKASRELTNVYFKAFGSGAIHGVEIDGTLSF